MEEGLLRPRSLNSNLDSLALSGGDRSHSDGASVGLRSNYTFIENEAEKIPLPNQIPPPFNVSHLPQAVLRSAAVESLLHQNEDLMARLNIQLRRNAQLEEDLSRLQNTSGVSDFRIQKLEDELLIYREKDRLVSQRTSDAGREISELNGRIRFLETQYAELYATSKKTQEEIIQKNHQLECKMMRLLRYRTRIRDIHQYQKDNRITSKLLNAKLAEATERLQQTYSVSRQEINQYKDEVFRLQSEVAKKQSLHLEIEALKDERATWHNQTIHAQRSLETDRQNSQNQIRQLQESLTAFRKEAKDKTLIITQHERDLLFLNDENAQVKKDNQVLLEQVESLQCLWRDNQNQLEKMESQIQALQKLNQHLSLQINQNRKEHSDYQNLKDSESFQANEKIKELSAQVKTLGNDRTRLEKETLTKIEGLISDIHLGLQSK